MAPTRSSGKPIRLMVCWLATCCMRSSGAKLIPGVRVAVGATALTVIPDGASSVANPRVRPMTAILELT